VKVRAAPDVSESGRQFGPKAPVPPRIPAPDLPLHLHRRAWRNRTGKL
jgi:hypothetical protein